MGKTVKMSFEGKSQQEIGKWTEYIDYFEKRKRPKGFICPCTGVKYHNIQTCLLVYAADSGERLQDHWFSGFCLLIRDAAFKMFWVYEMMALQPYPSREAYMYFYVKSFYAKCRLSSFIGLSD